MRWTLPRLHYRYRARFRQVATVLAQHGFTYLLHNLDLMRFVRRTEEVTEPERHPLPAEVASVLMDLGPTAVKAGQLLSTRPDLLPRPYLEALERLQDQGPIMPPEEVHKVIEEELGAPPRELFRRFDDAPVAAASIAQVHRAVLPDGTVVAVKVQRPGIREIIETDIEVAIRLATIFENRVPGARDFNIVETAMTLGELLRNELDFTREFHNAERLRLALEDLPYIVIPRMFFDYSSARVLTEEFIEGIKIADVEALKRQGSPRDELARRLAEAVLHQIYVHGYFHVDLHPGNIRVLPDHRLAFLDFGQVGELNPHLKREITRMLLAFLSADPNALCVHLIRLADGHHQDIDRSALREDLVTLMNKYRDDGTARPDLAEQLHDVFSVATRHHLRLPPEVGLLVKTYVTTEGICARLDPNFDYAQIARRLALRSLHPKWGLEDFWPRLWAASDDVRELLQNLPGRLNIILDHLAAGDLQTEVKHHGLPQLTEILDRVGTRLSSSIIVAALIIGSSLVIQSGVGPLIHGYPLFSVLGFVAAGVMGVWILLNIVRSGRLR